MPSLWPVLWIYNSCVNICKALNSAWHNIQAQCKNVTYILLFGAIFSCLNKHFLSFLACALAAAWAI